jgi:hypothetical protein
VCIHISELGTEPILIRSALKRGIRLCLLLLDLSDFGVSSYDLTPKGMGLPYVGFSNSGQAAVNSFYF